MISSTQYKWQLVRAGTLWLDGGSMFGVVPRVTWNKSFSTDDRNRIELAHNCLLLTRDDDPTQRILIESGSGNKFDAKHRDIYGLSDFAIHDALKQIGTQPEDISHVILSHLHFDHAGGATCLDAHGQSVPTFPKARVHVQQREWDDAIANNSVMTRTYLRENLDPIREHAKFIDSPPPYPIGHVPTRGESPRLDLVDRLREIVPGIFGLRVPGHTWGQQAILFLDERNRPMVFTPDIMPTVHHVGAAYNLAYDVEPFVSTNTRRWFLQAAVENEWTLILDHEMKTPAVSVSEDDKGWYKLTPK
jgi:glyoxylase-like metal-dependent hydrolase (beta-lactamase superfamily II)